MKQIALGCHGLPPNKEQQALIREWLLTLPKTKTARK